MTETRVSKTARVASYACRCGEGICADLPLDVASIGRYVPSPSTGKEKGRRDAA